MSWKKREIKEEMDLWKQSINSKVEKIIDKTSLDNLLEIAEQFKHFAYLRVKATQTNDNVVAEKCLKKMIGCGNPIDWELHNRFISKSQRSIFGRGLEEKWKIEEMNISIDHMLNALTKNPSRDDWEHIMIHLLPYRGDEIRMKVEECLMESPLFEGKDEIISWLKEMKKEEPRP